jgi:hypothetical protein
MAASTVGLATTEDEIRSLEVRMARVSTQTEIDGLASTMCTLRTTRNTFTPFGRLSFDILARVFELIASSYIECWEPANLVSKTPLQPEPVVAWQQLMQVCVLARDVAHHSPRLWSYLDLNWHPEWFQLCLRRAGSCRFSVMANEYPLRPSDDVGDVRKRKEAIRSVNLAFLKEQLAIIDASDHAYSRITAVLRSLSMRGKMIPVSTHWGPTAEMAVSLTNLSFRNLRLTLDIPHCPHLVQLAVIACRFRGTEREIYRHMAKIAPALQDLHAGSIFATEDEQYTPNIDESEGLLPLLQSMTIETSYRSATTVLSVFARPRSQLNIRVTDTRMEGDCEHWRGIMLAQMRRYASRTVGAGLHLRARHWTDVYSHEIDGCSLYIRYRNSTSRLTCLMWQEGVKDCSSVFDHYDTVQIYGKVAGPFFSYAAAHPTSAFASITHVIIRDGEGGLEELGSWLDARAVAGQPIQMVNFKRCKGYIDAHGTIGEIARKFIGEQARVAVYEDDVRLC